MRGYNIALCKQRPWTIQATPTLLPAPASDPTFRPKWPVRRFDRIAAAAAARNTSGNNGRAENKRWGHQAGAGDEDGSSSGGGGGGGGGGVTPGDIIIFKPAEESSSKRRVQGPLRRSSYRRTKEKAEEIRRQRADYQ
ncbi:hypothetical protein VOLCADRAFT_118977, partial [Volvox carteri f. nagariensis]